MSQPTNQNPQNQGWNYKLTKFFLDNSRLTTLAFVLLVVISTAATLLNTLSGFPEIEIKLAVVNTTYRGAAAETVLEDVTKPLENTISEVDGISNYTSQSFDSFSNIAITIEEEASTETVRNEIQAAIDSTSLPGDADVNFFIPSTGGPSFLYNISGSNLQETYQTYQTLKSEIENLEGAGTIEALVEVEPKIVITYDQTKVEETRADISQLPGLIQSLGQTIPVGSDIDLDGTSTTIVSSINDPENQLEALRALDIPVLENPFNAPQTNTPSQTSSPTQSQNNTQNSDQRVKLSEIATIQEQLFYVDSDGRISEDAKTFYSFYKDSQTGGVVRDSIIMSVAAKDGANLATLAQEIKDLVQEQENTQFLTNLNVNEADTEKTLVVESFSVDRDNQDQVNEVIQGLVGGKIGDSPLGYLGFILGAVQLVFLVMLAFVSWRSALIATISIPLSLLFATLYLFIIGESINFLVLFSLVLVIGLVVDPTLVILEAIQRKMDSGLKGKKAVLAAVKDIGNGLFSSTLTNIIVFLPLAVVSGFIGQIFSFIPATIIPAVIGSYIVAMIFLSWLGSIFLKPSKGTKNDEEKNLWPIAQWLIHFNEKILNLPAILRFLIIVVVLAIPITVTGVLFGSGQVAQVQFARNQNGTSMQVTYNFLPTVTAEQRLDFNQEIYQYLADNEAVQDVFPFSGGGQDVVFVNLKPRADRGQYSDITTLQFNDEILAKMREKFVQNASPELLLDINSNAVTTGPPTPSYQVSIAVNEDDLETLESASLDVSQTLQKTCLTEDNQVVIDENCEGGQKLVTKVDDGYTGKQGRSIDIAVNRSEFPASSASPNAQISFLVRNEVTRYTEDVGSILVDDKDLDIVIDQGDDRVNTLDGVKNIELPGVPGNTSTIDDIAEVREFQPKSVIQRLDGQTVNQIQARLLPEYQANQGIAAQVGNAVIEYYAQNDSQKSLELGLQENSVEIYQEGDVASTIRSFQELGIALLIAIFLIYAVLVIFFNSFTLPFVIMFTIPLTFTGVFPGVAYAAGGEFGFLETIGIIILAGLVVNVAIYLIDAARQKIDEEGWDTKRAIAYASGIRFRAVVLTNLTAVASLAPLAFFSEFYRSIAVTIIFGLTASALVSLITTPILFVFFKWSSDKFHASHPVNRILAIPLFPLYWIIWGVMDLVDNLQQPKKVVDVEIQEKTNNDKKEDK
jgi:HAE1 family hydrophobic/amphiphilic exporter-1